MFPERGSSTTDHSPTTFQPSLLQLHAEPFKSTGMIKQRGSKWQKQIALAVTLECSKKGNFLNHQEARVLGSAPALNFEHQDLTLFFAGHKAWRNAAETKAERCCLDQLLTVLLKVECMAE